MSLAQLVQIAPPPAVPLENGSAKQWEHLCKRLGTPLPPDYKDFIGRYGSGSFNNLITIYNPFAKNESLNLVQVLDTHHQANRHTQRLGEASWSAFHPFELYPASGGVLPWGSTASFNETFLWQVSGPPVKWVTIAYNLRNGEYEVWKLPFTIFLVKLLRKEIESVVLSSSFPSSTRRIQFVPEAVPEV